MKNSDEKINRSIWVIFGIALLTRLIFIGKVPGNGALHGDEAYAGYNAWSLLHYGVDSEGYINPVYFVAWGSGMNALEIYCMIPFVAVFGLNPVGIRMCPAIFGIITVIFFYKLLRDFSSREKAILGLSIIAIIPWHIMISRWGLESNFFPGFLLIAVYFLLKVTEDSRYSMLGMLFYGLTLYAYSADWVIMPFLLISLLVLFWIKGNLKIDRYWIISIIILTIVAMPLLLFILVNYGLVEPISTFFITIPRLTHFRNSDVSLSVDQVWLNIKAMNRILVRQEDPWVWNCMWATGIYYKVSGPFIVLGIIKTIISAVKEREKLINYVILIWFFYGLVLGLMIDGNINRLNILHIPVIFFITTGISWVCGLVRDRFSVIYKAFICALVLVYAAYFIRFETYYNNKYSNIFGARFAAGMKEALEYCQENEDWDVCILGISYPEVLVNLNYPTDEYLKTVVWDDPDSSFRPMHSFGDRYYFYDFTSSEPEKGVYYLAAPYNEGFEYALEYMNENHMDIMTFDKVVVGVVK